MAMCLQTLSQVTLLFPMMAMMMMMLSLLSQKQTLGEQMKRTLPLCAP